MNEKEKQISIHFKLQDEINKSKPVCEQFEFKNYASTVYELGEPDQYGWIYDMKLGVGIRNASKSIQLPTVLCCFEDSTQNYFAIESEIDLFGRSVIRFFRDENLDYHYWHIQKFTNKTLEEIENQIPNHWQQHSIRTHMEKAKFFNKLDREQINFLNRYIKELIDSLAFNVMRAIDENTGNEGDPIKITINNIDATQLPMIGNGNLSGEYIDWCERFSKYGKNFFVEF